MEIQIVVGSLPMPERDLPPFSESIQERNMSDSPTSALPPAPKHSVWWKTWQVFKTLQARIRFFILLAIIGVVIGSWSTMTAYWEKWTRPLLGQEQEVSSDTEY